jgi:hypothetical protein
MGDKPKLEKQDQDTQERRRTPLDLVYTIVKDKDPETLQSLTNLPQKMLNPLAKMDMHRHITSVLCEQMGEMQAWYDKRSGITTPKKEDSEVVSKLMEEGSEIWERGYYRRSRSKDGDIMGLVGDLAGDQIRADGVKPDDNTGWDNVAEK